MKVLWTSQDIAAATTGRAAGQWDADGISIDSRSVSAGDLFIALEGPRFDGHDFVSEALNRGASAAMVTTIPEESKDTVSEDRLVIVNNTLEGLKALAANARSRSAAKIAAITGSVGKTTTKDALTLVLGRQGNTHATIGNLNNHLGVPLSLARMPQETNFGVFELGMNHAGEIEPLSQIVRPNVAVITAVEPVHLENFESVEDIAEAKSEIFSGLETHGTVIIPADSPHFDLLEERALSCDKCQVIGFGTDRRATYRLIAWTVTETGTRVAADINGRRIVYEIGLSGKHLAGNSLAVLAAVDVMGGDVEQAAGDLYDMRPPKGRGAKSIISVSGGTFFLIDESYNASPVSICALVESLAATRRTGRVILVLGDMLELGNETEAFHKTLADPIASTGVDAVYTAGPLMHHLHNALPKDIEKHHAGDSQAIAKLVAAHIKAGDTVAVKGSFGSKMSVVVDALKEMGSGDDIPATQSVVNGE